LVRVGGVADIGIGASKSVINDLNTRRLRTQ
jgi:hypothetical protein